jgi:hypothetical protein
MEEAFQSLTAGKVQELLVFCGIGDCNYEPIKQHILGISDFGEPGTLLGRLFPLTLYSPRKEASGRHDRSTTSSYSQS